MWIDVRIYRTKANSQATNLRVDIITSQKDQSRKAKSLRFVRKFSRGLESRKGRCWGYVLPVFQNTPEKLILKSIFSLKVVATLLSGSR